jgi:hypothetical protein
MGKKYKHPYWDEEQPKLEKSEGGATVSPLKLKLLKELLTNPEETTTKATLEHMKVDEHGMEKEGKK